LNYFCVDLKKKKYFGIFLGKIIFDSTNIDSN